MIDPVGVSTQIERLLRVKTKDFDSLVDRAGCQCASVKVHRQHALCMALQRADAFAGVPIPDLDHLVKAATDELVVIKLECPDRRRVSTKGAKHFSRLNVPDLDRSIIRARSKYVVIKLKTSDTILVALERLDGTSSSLPVVSDLESISVHVFPRSKLALSLELRLRVTGSVEPWPLRGTVFFVNASLVRHFLISICILGLAMGRLLVAAPGL